jgi:hypothetical protein
MIGDVHSPVQAKSIKMRSIRTAVSPSNLGPANGAQRKAGGLGRTAGLPVLGSPDPGYVLSPRLPPAANFLQHQARFYAVMEVLQSRADARSTEYEVSGRGLPVFPSPLLRVTGHRFHEGRRSHHLRMYLSGGKKSTSAQSSPVTRSASRKCTKILWLLAFLDYDFRYFDLNTGGLEPLENPFGPRLAPM